MALNWNEIEFQLFKINFFRIFYFILKYSIVLSLKIIFWKNKINYALCYSFGKLKRVEFGLGSMATFFFRTCVQNRPGTATNFFSGKKNQVVKGWC